MKKILLIFLLLFISILISCKDANGTTTPNKTIEQVDNNDNKDDEPIGEEDKEEESQDIMENGDDNNQSSNNEDNEPAQLSFVEDDFKYEIVIERMSDNYKKVFDDSDYLEFFNVIKDYKYQSFDQCTSCTEPLYKITYNENIILVYEYNFFKINDVLFELTTDTFDFLSEYEYKNSESSGWLPWI